MFSLFFIFISMEFAGNLNLTGILQATGSDNHYVCGTLTTDELSVVGIVSASAFCGDGSNLSGIVTGTGTSGYVPKWSGTTSQSDSLIYDDGTCIGIGITSPGAELHVNGNIIATDIDAKASCVNNTNGDTCLKFWSGTQAQYDALTPAADTIYFII